MPRLRSSCGMPACRHACVFKEQQSHNAAGTKWLSGFVGIVADPMNVECTYNLKATRGERPVFILLEELEAMLSA